MNMLTSQNDIIQKLDSYKKHGLLVSEITYEFGNDKETAYLYEKAVAFGFVDVMRYLEKNGLSHQNTNLIDLQIRSRPSLETIQYLVSKGQIISATTQNKILEDQKFKSNHPDIYHYLKN